MSPGFRGAPGRTSSVPVGDDSHPGTASHLHLGEAGGGTGPKVHRAEQVVLRKDQFRGRDVLTQGPYVLPGGHGRP